MRDDVAREKEDLKAPVDVRGGDCGVALPYLRTAPRKERGNDHQRTT
jgi:hypothetical protein